MRVTSTGPPRGVSLYLPLPYSASSGSSAVSSGAGTSYPSLSGWPSLCRLAYLWVLCVVCCPLLPLFQLPYFPLNLYLFFGFVHPVPWPLGLVGPVVVVPGFGHYVGRLLAGS